MQHEAEAEGLAAALFKDDPRTNPFFVMVPRQIFVHLLIEQPKRTPQELLAILRDERELAKRSRTPNTRQQSIPTRDRSVAVAG